jgi:hypothetical protein
MATHVLMPIGDTGRDLTETEAAELSEGGKIALCRQCSTDERQVYH